MRKIEKKTWPELFEKVLSGQKKFDLRLAEFKCSEGDILVLKEWNPDTEEYTGRELEKEITFVMETKEIDFWSKEEMERLGFVVMSLK